MDLPFRSSNVSRTETLKAFFDAASDIVGEENVSRDPSLGALPGLRDSVSYGDAFPLKRKIIPDGALRPKTVKEIQAIVHLSNRTKIPLWTVSRGKNLGYGGTSPVVDGTVILDLHRMNNIIEISEEYGYAIVEPGVSFFDIYDTILERSLALWPSVPALGWGSIVGNTLDKGFGYTTEGEHVMSQCGAEIVLPDGEVLRTGMGAMPGSKLFALHKSGFGPMLDGLFFQSNYGIVTKMGIQIMPAPEAYLRMEIHVQNEEDVIPLSGMLTELCRRKIILNSPHVTNLFGLVLECQDPDVAEEMIPYVTMDRTVPEDVLERIRQRKKWGRWKGTAALYGPKDIVTAQLEVIKARFEKILGAEIRSELIAAEPGKFLKGNQTPRELIPMNGVPTIASLAALTKTPEGYWHNSFSPIIPPSGRELYDYYQGAKKKTTEAGLNFLADFHLYGRYILAINLVFFAPSKQKDLDALHHNLMTYTRSLGFSEYRAHVNYMEDVASNFSFNNNAMSRITTRLKDTLDPNGILSPGKSGIWNSKSLKGQS